MPNNNSPFWHQVNRLGILTKTPSAYFSFKSRKQSLEFAFTSIIYKNKWNKSLIQIGYLSKKINDYELKIGRWKEELSSESSLSTGSLIKGKNTIPLPQISFKLPSYKNIQILKTNFFIKAGYSHIWLSKGSYLKAPFIHEKYLYLKKLFKNGSNFEVGLIHEAIWGGETIEYNKQPQKLSDYIRVVFGRPASTTGLEGEQTNVLGNHLGIWDISYSKNNLNFYFQHPFEDKSGAYQNFFDELKKFRLPINSFDGLWGLEIINKNNKILNKFLIEYVNTMYQSGPKAATDSTYGMDNYYNHYIYRSGWTYKGNIISNPLFTIGKHPDNDFNGPYIINNRIKAFHLGFEGEITEKLIYNLLLTHSQNFGTYGDKSRSFINNEEYKFKNGLKQFSFLLMFNFKNVTYNTDIKISYALDKGKHLENSQGLLISLNYNLTNLSYSQ